MTDYVSSYPRARKRHWCGLCGWQIMPGEVYRRGVRFECSTAWTWKECPWCERVAARYGREHFNHYGEEYDRYGVAEWLEEQYPAVWAQMEAGWRYPDGERVPLPLQGRCHTCGTLTRDMRLWCPPCDAARIARIEAQLRGIAADLKAPDERREEAPHGDSH